MERSSLSDSGVLASDEAFRLESRRLGAGLSTGIAFSKSDVVLLFFDGDLKLSAADRVRAVTAPAHAYVNAGTAFDITADGDDVSYLIATCPATGLEAAHSPNRRGDDTPDRPLRPVPGFRFGAWWNVFS